jgi:hypothetical protein
VTATGGSRTPSSVSSRRRGLSLHDLQYRVQRTVKDADEKRARKRCRRPKARPDRLQSPDTSHVGIDPARRCKNGRMSALNRKPSTPPCTIRSTEPGMRAGEQYVQHIVEYLTEYCAGTVCGGGSWTLANAFRGRHAAIVNAFRRRHNEGLDGRNPGLRCVRMRCRHRRTADAIRARSPCRPAHAYACAQTPHCTGDSGYSSAWVTFISKVFLYGQAIVGRFRRRPEAPFRPGKCPKSVGLEERVIPVIGLQDILPPQPVSPAFRDGTRCGVDSVAVSVACADSLFGQTAPEPRTDPSFQPKSAPADFTVAG